jgi:hypothetical protein
MKTRTAFATLALGVLLMATAVSAQPKDWQFEVGATAKESRDNWDKLTQGEELARGKAVEISPVASYYLTHDENDAYDLTDGKLSERMDDRVWFVKDAVGWNFGSGAEGASGVLFRIDLGSVQPIGQIAIRLLGGREQQTLILPNAIEFLASEDGKNYHSLRNMKKLMPAERELSDFVTGFFVPEEGKAFMYPFAARVPVRARYVAIRITPEADVYTDQISILKADGSTPILPLSSFPRSRVFTEGFVVRPKLDVFAVTTNIMTPNWVLLQSFGKDAGSKAEFDFRLQLPQGLRLRSESKPEFTELETAHGARRYLFKKVQTTGASTSGRNPLYIETVPGEKVAPNAKAKFTGIINGTDSHTLEYPVQLVEIPEVPTVMTETFDIGLGWINDWEQRGWPNYLQSLRKIGFGEVSTYPMWWGVGDYLNKPDSQANLQFVREARAQSFGIVHEESPFHQMLALIESQRKAGVLDAAEAALIFNQTAEGKPGKHLNPLYRGQYYQDEIKRIAELVALVQPDQLHLDIELWWEAANEAKTDPRVAAAWQASGKEWDDFISDAGTEMLRDVAQAARGALPNRKLVIGLYHSDPKNKVMDGIFDWNKIYPAIVDIAQPSIYVQGRAADVAARIRHNYQAMGNRKIIPWLTAGTYGEFDPKLMEPMVLETILNGAGGMTYYYFPDFDPLDFYYHAKALATLGQFPNLMKTGRPVTQTGSTPGLHYTCFASDKERLILVGNYGRSPQTKTTLPLAVKGAKNVQVIGHKTLPIRNNAISIDVPAGEFRLIHVKGS